MKMDIEDKILIIHLEREESLFSLKEEILDSAKRENVYVIAFIITEEWKFDINEAEDVYLWMKEIPFITLIAIQEEICDSDKIFSLFSEYRLTRVNYKINLSKVQGINLKSRCKLLYGEQINIDEEIEIRTNVEDKNIYNAILKKGKEWFQGKSAEHITNMIYFYKNFSNNLSEGKLLNLESYTFCKLINGE